MPPTDQVPAVWAFYPGHGWIQYQWILVPVPPLIPPAAAAPPSAAAPPQFLVIFDGTPNKLSYFLNRIWAQIEHYGAQFQSDQDMISAIIDNMREGEAADWIAQFRDEGAPELEDVDEFVRSLIARFVDPGNWEEAETKIKGLKQCGNHLKS